MKRPLVAFALLATALSMPAPAWADAAKTRAKEAYDRGLAAHRRGDPRVAAHEFARADALLPSPVALRAALDSAIEADDVALGAELLERSKRAPPPPALAASITAAHIKFKDRAVDGTSGATSDTAHQTTSATTKDATHSREGLPRTVFYGGVGLTVALAGITTYLALETQSEHDRFRDVGCGQTRFPECEGIKESGERHQTLTNVMLVLTGASAVATTVIGVAFTNWKGPLLTAAPGGAGATWQVTF